MFEWVTRIANRIAGKAPNESSRSSVEAVDVELRYDPLTIYESGGRKSTSETQLDANHVILNPGQEINWITDEEEIETDVVSLDANTVEAPLVAATEEVSSEYLFPSRDQWLVDSAAGTKAISASNTAVDRHLTDDLSSIVCDPLPKQDQKIQQEWLNTIEDLNNERDLGLPISTTGFKYPTATPIPNWAQKKKISAGGVVLAGLGPTDIERVYVVSPTNQYGGYHWVFPKGRVESGMTQEATALKEVLEESGIQARLLPDGYLGAGEGTTSITHYYMMLRVGGYPHKHESEIEEVRLVTLEEAMGLFQSTGNTRDTEILTLAAGFIGVLKNKLGYR